jgi:hypothetical protein
MSEVPASGSAPATCAPSTRTSLGPLQRDASVARQCLGDAIRHDHGG